MKRYSRFVAIVQPSVLYISVVFLVASLSLAAHLAAQTHLPVCGTEQVLRSVRKNPALSARQVYNDNLIYNATRYPSKSSVQLQGNEKFRIPVVVHIVHNDGEENIPDDQVRLGIQLLNDAFANRGYYDSTSGVAVNIEFCLAEQDPNGAYTTGITRSKSDLTEMTQETEDTLLKKIDRWDPLHYVNIWVVREVASKSTGPSLSAYAYYPSSHGNAEDGIVIESRWFATTSANTSVLVHEMGHYLGLYHTWEDGCFNSDCLLQGDHVCDTPPDVSTIPVQCWDTYNSCYTDEDDSSPNNPFRSIALGGLGDQNDMISNYMDYGILKCASVFTAGQRERMIRTLTLVRFSLLDSKGCVTPCKSPITADFGISPIIANVGETVYFMNHTVGAASWEWSINGVPYSQWHTPPVRSFAAAGEYVVILKVKGADTNCVSEIRKTIKVVCTATAAFTPTDLTIKPGEGITFKNYSKGASFYKWFVDGTQVSTLTDYYTPFPVAGGYRVYLVAGNSTCSDTSDAVFVRVGNCSSRKEANNWYFGDEGGISFASGEPVPMTNGKFSSVEGVTTISDSEGNFLLHSDGVEVWNMFHQPLSHSKPLGGNHLSAQSALLIPKPNHPNIFYLFTTTDWNDSNHTAYYTIIDIHQNGGMGRIIQEPTPLHNNVSERIVATYHANCKDVWIITHEMNNNRYVAYLLTEKGLEAKPVLSDVGSAASGSNRFGALRASPDGKRICSTLGGTKEMPTIELLDFDSNTGVLSNAVAVVVPGRLSQAYCSEFSADMSKLYVVEYRNKFVYQFDISTNDTARIRASMLTVSTSSDIKGALQMGPDGVIYVTRYGNSLIDAIRFPNASGAACGYTRAVLSLIDSHGNAGLPNFLSGYFLQKVSVIAPRRICKGVPITLHAVRVGCIAGEQKWTVLGKVTIRDSTAERITITPLDTGIVRVFASQLSECGIYSDSVDIVVGLPTSLELGPEKKICSSSNPVTLDAGEFTSYLWSNGSITRTISVNTPGSYWVEIHNQNGCVARDTIVVRQSTTGKAPDLGRDIFSCEKVVRLDAGAGYRSYRWMNGMDTRALTIYQPGTYWVTVTDSCDNVFSDTIVVGKASAGVPPNLGSDVTICSVANLVLDGGAGYISYVWQDGAMGRYYPVPKHGSYSVTVSDSCGNIFYDTIEVHQSGPLTAPELGNDITLCIPTPVTLDAGDGFRKYLWQDGSTNRFFTTSSGGSYYVTVTDSCGNILRDTMNILINSVQGVFNVSTRLSPPQIGQIMQLPLYAGMGKAATYPLTLPKVTIRISFDRRVFMPATVSLGDWRYSERGDTGIVSIIAQNVLLNSEQSLMGQLEGTYLLSGFNSAAFHIEVEADSCISTQTTTAEVDVQQGSCFYTGREIRITNVAALTIFPNPADDKIRCSVTLPNVQGNTRITLIATDGKEYVVHDERMDEGSHLIDLDISSLPSGVYTCRLSAGASVVLMMLSVIH